MQAQPLPRVQGREPEAAAPPLASGLPWYNDVMELPIQFPDYADEIRRDAEEFRALPADERLRLMSDLVNGAFWLVQNSSNRETVERMIQASEDAWQARQQEAFARYGRGEPTSAE